MDKAFITIGKMQISAFSSVQADHPARLVTPEARSRRVEGSGMVSPLSEKAALNVGAGVPPTMSVPIRSQSGSKLEFRIQLCKSGVNGVPVVIGFGADNQRNSPPVT